jgi:serine protease
MVEGHEYSETITDQFPAGGWIDASGWENADKCSWNGVGGTTGAVNVTTATGTFAMQATWSNDIAACSNSHATVGGPPAAATMAASPTAVTVAGAGTRGPTSVTVTISTTAGSGTAPTLTFSAATVAGVTATFSPKTVVAGGTTTLTLTAGSSVATALGTTTVTASAPATSSAPASKLTVGIATTALAAAAAIANGGFDVGSAAGWTSSGQRQVVAPGRSTVAALRLGSTGATNGDSSAVQTFVANGTTLALSTLVHCTGTVSTDWATVTLKNNTTGVTTTPLAKTCTNTGSWQTVTAPLVLANNYTVTLLNHDDNKAATPTYTLFDDVAVG